MQAPFLFVTTGSSLVYKVGTTAINDAYVWTGTPATDVKKSLKYNF